MRAKLFQPSRKSVRFIPTRMLPWLRYCLIWAIPSRPPARSAKHCRFWIQHRYRTTNRLRRQQWRERFSPSTNSPKLKWHPQKQVRLLETESRLKRNCSLRLSWLAFAVLQTILEIKLRPRKLSIEQWMTQKKSDSSVNSSTLASDWRSWSFHPNRLQAPKLSSKYYRKMRGQKVG